MKRVLLALSLILLLLLAYLLAWPVAVDPVAWDAPEDKGYVGDFAPNEKLANLELLDIGKTYGPEDVTSREIEGEMFLFVPTHDGKVQKIDPKSGAIETIANTGGVPLGTEFDAEGNLIIADAYKGLVSVAMDGTVTVLTDTVDGTPILYADDLDIAENGVIYFSDASTKFGAEWAGSTMQGSLYEIMEHGRTGRILTYDPATQKTSVVMENLSFANGVAMGPKDSSIYVNETGEYRVLRHWIKGPKKGETDVLMDNLPGFPDNINRGPGNSYYVGLVSKRSKVLDDMSAKPFTRKVIWRLPEFMKPAAENYGFIIQMRADGHIMRTWQDPSGAYPSTTGAHLAEDGHLYITSLTATKLGRLNQNKKQ